MKSHNLTWESLDCLRWDILSVRSKKNTHNVPQDKKLPFEHLPLPEMPTQDTTVQLVFPLALLHPCASILEDLKSSFVSWGSGKEEKGAHRQSEDIEKR